MTHMTTLPIPPSDAQAPVTFSFHPRLTLPAHARWAKTPVHAPVAGDAGVELETHLCFVAGTRLITREGRLPVERLSAGKTVWTLQNGFQPLRAMGRSTIRLSKRCFARRPVLLRKDALRPGAPLRDIRIPPRLNLLVDDWINEPDLNEAGCFVSAAKLIEQDRAQRDLHCKSVTYFYLVFDKPEIVETEGLLSQIPASEKVNECA